MTRKSGVVIAFAGMPILSGLLLLAGCDSGDTSAVAITPEERDAKVKSSMDYMRQQQESRQQKKR